MLAGQLQVPSDMMSSSSLVEAPGPSGSASVPGRAVAITGNNFEMSSLMSHEIKDTVITLDYVSSISIFFWKLGAFSLLSFLYCGGSVQERDCHTNIHCSLDYFYIVKNVLSSVVYPSFFCCCFRERMPYPEKVERPRGPWQLAAALPRILDLWERKSTIKIKIITPPTVLMISSMTRKNPWIGGPNTLPL